MFDSKLFILQNVNNFLEERPFITPFKSFIKFGELPIFFNKSLSLLSLYLFIKFSICVNKILMST